MVEKGEAHRRCGLNYQHNYINHSSSIIVYKTTRVTKVFVMNRIYNLQISMYQFQLTYLLIAESLFMPCFGAE
jgi:hypothetical protein